MKNKSVRIDREKRTINAMIIIYCHSQHENKTGLCDECNKTLEYAFLKIEHCRHHSKKPVCNKCTIHCFSKEMREKIKIIMRFAGPKMIFKHPYLGLMRFVESMRSKTSR